MGPIVTKQGHYLEPKEYISKCMETVGVNITDDAIQRTLELADGNLNVARYLINQSVIFKGRDLIDLNLINKAFPERKDHYYDDSFRDWWYGHQKIGNYEPSMPDAKPFEFSRFAADNMVDRPVYWENLLAM